MKYLKPTLAVAVLVTLGIVWWTQYVQPKAATLMAASQCVTRQGYAMNASKPPQPVWNVCLKTAEAQHATALLLAVGY